MAGAAAVSCRRSPHLVCFWRDSQFVVQNYATGTLVAADALTCDVLNFFHDWRPVRAFLAGRPAAARSGFRLLLNRLIDLALLERRGARRSERERAMDAWQAWNPAAGFFHTATKDVPFIDMPRQVRVLGAKTQTTPMPSALKRYRAAERIPLTATPSTSEFVNVLLKRRTWRRFGAQPVDAKAFGALLNLTGGVQRWAYAEGEGQVALKTSPSGGARHSIELYALARRVRGLRAGLYHYAAAAHCLELIDSRPRARAIERFLPRQPWFENAAAIVFFAAVFERELWRYGYARAYRAVLIEAGHLCQTFCLTATWLGLAPFCTMALADSTIEKELRLDGVSESVLYAAGVGSQPAGVEPPAAAHPSARSLDRGEVARFPGRIVRRRRR